MNEQSKAEVKKIVCPQCKDKDNCFEEVYPLGDAKGYLCKSCGYTSTSYFTKDSKYLENALKTLPELIKNLKFFDKKRKIYWFLAVVRTEEGTVFPESNETDWHWTYAPIIEMSDEEAQDYPIVGKENTVYSHRIAIEQAIKFNKDDFKSALKKIKFIKSGL